MSKESPEPLYRKVYSEIKRQILDGVFHPEKPLPTQLEFAKRLNVGEVTVKRAMQDLAAEGLVHRFRKKGTYIQPPKRSLPDGEGTLSRIVLLVPPNVDMRRLQHPYYLKLMAGIGRACERYGLAFHLREKLYNEQLPLDEQTGYILFMHEMFTNELEAFLDRNRRAVHVQNDYPRIAIPYVVVDDVTGGYLATQHLLALRHRRIGVILNGKPDQLITRRLQGYQSALHQCGIAYDPQLVQMVDEQQETEEAGYHACVRLLALEQRPTAFFVGSDYKAYGAMRAIREAGLRMPQDVSIIGYDDMPFNAYTEPPLTSVAENTDKLGEKAVALLLENRTNHYVRELILPSLVIRASTAMLQD